MKEFTKKGKRIAAVAAAIAVSAAAVFGIGTAVRKTTSSSVPVIEVSSINYGMWLDWENSVTGIVTTEAEQTVYLSDTEKVLEVLVSEGQAVHKGDVLLRYDTKSTQLNLEKEKINREMIELNIEIAKENIKTLDRISPISDDGDGMLIPDDFSEFEEFTETLKEAKVYKKILRADAKPANADPEDETLGSEDNPYLFLCDGDTVTITSDFIKKWQRVAKKAEMEQLYIALQKRDKTLGLERSWITNVMLLDPELSLEVDLATGKTGFSALNDEVKIAKLLKKLLEDIPEDERASWLAVMLDKMLIFTEREDESTERGVFLAEVINELNKEDQKELAAAAAHLDEETLSTLFKSLTPEQIESVEEEASAALLTMLLENMTQEKIRAMDAEVLSAFLEKLTAEQLTSLSTETLCEVLGALNTDQLKAVMEGLSDEKRQEILEILQKYEEEHGQDQGGDSGDDPDGSGSGNTGSESSGSGSTADEGPESGSSVSEDSGNGNSGGESGDSGTGSSQADQEDQTGGKASGSGEESSAGSGETGTETEEAGGSKEEGSGSEVPENSGNDQGAEGSANSGSGTSGVEGTPSTAPSPSEDNGGGSGGGQLLSSDTSYTSDELAQAKREEKEKLLGLELDLKESDIKIKQAQRAVDSGVVMANMNGVIKSVSDPDAPPSDGSAFLTLAGVEGLFVRSGIKENMLGKVTEGDIVTVTSWQNGNTYEAQIKSISPYPDTTGMFDDGGNQTYYPFTASILGEDTGFGSGEWVEVTYTADTSSGEDTSDTLTVMKAFVREEENKKYVYIRDENGLLKKQYIVTGSLTDSGYEIISGLSSSDWIAFPYGKDVKEGAKTREGSLEDLYGG